MSEASGKLSVEYIPIEQVKPYENNPRVNDAAVDKVAASIQEFGWQQPIVVDKDNVVVVGHTRLKAAKELGMETVPVHKATELSDEDVKAYRLVDNKSNEFAEWDFTMLQDELAALEDVDMTQFGFFNAEIDWDNVQSLTPSAYEPPVHDMIRCPSCGHVDRKEHFMKVSGQEDAEES